MGYECDRCYADSEAEWQEGECCEDARERHDASRNGADGFFESGDLLTHMEEDADMPRWMRDFAATRLITSH